MKEGASSPILAEGFQGKAVLVFAYYFLKIRCATNPTTQR